MDYKNLKELLFRRNTFQRLCLMMCIAFGSLFTTLSAQQRTITGKVIDEEGSPLAGVSIVIQGTSNGALSTDDGTFSLQASPDQTLVFKYFGKETTSVLVGSQSSINITLPESVESIEEVVVVGYGTVKKSDVISSVTSVKPENMTKVATSDIGEMLRGKAAGVQVTLSNGGPGASSNILIRGQNSINGGNAPLVIVDGVPVGNINDINPNDIASLEILKDAAAQSIYGARASNGVILITTKRGNDGITSVSYNGNSGIQTYNRNFEIYSGEEFAQLKREAFRSANLGVYPADADIMSSLELNSVLNGEYINWEEEILRLGSTQNHNVSISSGTKNSSVYTSFNLFDQNGVIENSDYTRVTARVNLDQRVNNWFKIGMNTSFQYSNGDNPNVGGVLLTSITTSPLGQIYNEDGTLRYLPGGFEENKNPLIDIYETNTRSENRNDIVNIYLDISPFRGFNYRVNGSRRSWNGKALSYNTGQSVTGVTNGSLGRGSITFQDNVEWQVENIITYKPTFNSSKQNLNFTAVQSVIESKYNRLALNSNDLPNDILGIYGLESAATNVPFISGNRRGLVSIAGKIDYNYNSKYYLSLSARSDASTVFGANNKWGFFPAVGMGWNIHHEEFMQNIPAIYNLKLRASYGSVGNEGIAPYQSLSTALQRGWAIYTPIKVEAIPLVAGEQVIRFLFTGGSTNLDKVIISSPGVVVAERFGIYTERAVTGGIPSAIEQNNAFLISPTSTDVFEGAQSMEFKFDAQDTWGVMGAFRPSDGAGGFVNVDISEYATGFYNISLKTTCPFKMNLRLQGGGTNGFVQLDDAVRKYGLLRDGAWHTLKIPIADFKTDAGATPDYSQISHLLVLRSAEPAVTPTEDWDWYVDDMYLTKE